MEARPYIQERNFAVIQYEDKQGKMKVIAFSDYDVASLKHRVSLYLSHRKIISIQIYYSVDTAKMSVRIPKKGVFVE